MNYPINFLPWRQRRRAACLRFWGVMFAATLLLALTLILSGYAVLHASDRVNILLQEAENLRAASFAAAKSRLAQRQLRAQQVLQQMKQQEQTQRWQPGLENLVQRLPLQVWLTGMDYQQQRLELTGKALTFSALSDFDTSLRESQAFLVSHTGATQQDDQGFWQFHYQLAWREPDDRSL